MVCSCLNSFFFFFHLDKRKQKQFACTWHQQQYQFSSVSQPCPTLSNPMDCSTPGLPVHHQLLELAQTHVHQAGDAIQPSHPCHPLLLLPSVFPSIKIFSSESVLRIRWPKYWSSSFSISIVSVSATI